MLTLQKNPRNPGAQVKLTLSDLLHKREHQLDSLVDISKKENSGKGIYEVLGPELGVFKAGLIRKKTG